MTSSVTNLEDYWKPLHLFGETFGLHTKTSTAIIVEIPQAIERLEQVYSFAKKCVDAVTSLIGTTAVTQGPQGTTVSSVVMEDEGRILKSLRDIKDLLNHFNPNLTTKWEVVPTAWIRLQITDWAGQSKKGLKRQCFTPFAYLFIMFYTICLLHSSRVQVFTTTYYNDLPKLCPPKAHKLFEKQVSEIRNWRAMYVFVCRWFSDCTAPRFHSAESSSRFSRFSC